MATSSPPTVGGPPRETPPSPGQGVLEAGPPAQGHFRPRLRRQPRKQIPHGYASRAARMAAVGSQNKQGPLQSVGLWGRWKEARGAGSGLSADPSPVGQAVCRPGGGGGASSICSFPPSETCTQACVWVWAGQGWRGPCLPPLPLRGAQSRRFTGRMLLEWTLGWPSGARSQPGRHGKPT